nr:hypothetical protein [Blautia caecimuris]
MTREENLLYRRNCPYDAMGDYSLLICREMKKTEPLTQHPQEQSEKEQIRQYR